MRALDFQWLAGALFNMFLLRVEAVRPRHLRDQHRDFAAESIAAITGGGISTAFGGSGAVAFDEAMNSSNGGGNERVRDLSTLFQPPTAIMFQGTYAGVRICVPLIVFSGIHVRA